MQKLKWHGNGGSCLKTHEKLRIKMFAFMHPAGLSKFFKCTSTSLFTGSTFS